jgi:putative molybdopterin biosynthesis protein
VVARGNPRALRGVRDLVRARRLVRPAPAGAAAQALVERLLRREGLTPPPYRARILVAHGHMRCGAWWRRRADMRRRAAGVARAHGLDFIPLAEERFDLDRREGPRAGRARRAPAGNAHRRGFRREIGAWVGTSFATRAD